MGFFMLGIPARLVGRLPLFARYIWGAFSNLLAPSTYALHIFGPSYRLRSWLILDASQLEHMLHRGTDDDILAFRNAHMASNASTAVVGSLLASACTTVLTLPSLSDVNLTVRGIFTVSLMLSLLAVYFTLVRQKGSPVKRVKESSVTSSIIREAPLEVLSIAITLLWAGLMAYLGLVSSRCRTRVK
ncbi:hypothetical protein LTR08_002892 [Meristemomyces frigidus]|nr:hypothetical protein LTR08_002892 [Meristemomyces frigidus]